jgi:tRNA G10  N-methylase Trm11
MEKRYFLILSMGDLSKAEVKSYLHANKINYSISKFSDAAAIIDTELPNFQKIIKRLGGIYKIGLVGCILNDKDIDASGLMREKLDASKFYDHVDEKIRWGISYYIGNQSFGIDFPRVIHDYFNNRLRKDGARKAKYITSKRKVAKGQEIISDDLLKKNLIQNGLEISIISIPPHFYFGKTLEVVRNKEFIDRDLKRPHQNPKTSIPPKIARVLVNLTGLKHGETILDPFCGGGTILQEAAILGFRILGGDKNKERVMQTKKNLEWLSQTYKLKIEDISRRIFTSDAKNISKYLSSKVDGIATEPILLPPLKKFPHEKEANDMLEIARARYLSVLPEIIKVLKRGGRLTIVVPRIRTKSKKQFSFSLEEILKTSGTSLYFSFKDLRDHHTIAGIRDQRVLRDIYVFEKT